MTTDKQFNFWTNGDEIKAARGDTFIRVGDADFDYNKVWSENVETIFWIYDFFQGECEDPIGEMRVYGEVASNVFVVSSIIIGKEWIEDSLVKEICKEAKVHYEDRSEEDS